MRFFLLIFAVSCCLTCSAYAEFSIETDLPSIDFGSAELGEIIGDVPAQGIRVTCRTDGTFRWTLRTYVELPLTHNSSSESIPNEDFFVYAMPDSTGAGTLRTDEQDFSEEQILYTSPTEQGEEEVTVRLQYKIKIPNRAQSGTYSTFVYLTLIEEGPLN